MGMNAGGGNPAGYVPSGTRGPRPGESFGPISGTTGGGGENGPVRRGIGGGYNGPTPVGGGGGVNPGPINWNPPPNVPIGSGPYNPQPGPPLGNTPGKPTWPIGVNLGGVAPAAEGGVYNPNPLAPKGGAALQNDIAYPPPITDTFNLGKPTFSGGYAPPPPQGTPATTNAAKQGFAGTGVGVTKPGAVPVKMPPIRGLYPSGVR